MVLALIVTGSGDAGGAIVHERVKGRGLGTGLPPAYSILMPQCGSVMTGPKSLRLGNTSEQLAR